MASHKPVMAYERSNNGEGIIKSAEHRQRARTAGSSGLTVPAIPSAQLDGGPSPEETAAAGVDSAAPQRICKCEEMEFMMQNCSARRRDNNWQQLKSGGRTNLSNEESE